MNGIDTFPIDRFKNSTNLLTTLCSKNTKDIWINPANSSNVKALIYKGSFMDCIEYLYGFIPDIFREYCKQFSIPVYTYNVKRVGHLDLMNALYEKDVLSMSHNNLLKKLFLTRGEIIHSTLWTKDQYYNKLSWIVLQLDRCDLDGLCKFIITLCNKINASYKKGVNNNLIVKERNNYTRTVPSDAFTYKRIYS